MAIRPETEAKNEYQPVVTDAATLCKRLRESFTGVSKLQVIRDLLARNPDATAEQAYSALVEDQTVPQKTLDKARGIIDKGYYTESTDYGGALPMEDQILQVREMASAGRLPVVMGRSDFQPPTIAGPQGIDAVKRYLEAHPNASSEEVYAAMVGGTATTPTTTPANRPSPTTPGADLSGGHRSTAPTEIRTEEGAVAGKETPGGPNTPGQPTGAGGTNPPPPPPPPGRPTNHGKRG